MSFSSSHTIVTVLGPTASGKSALAVALARKFHGEVISADSRQVYKGLTIGTGKITQKEMRGVPHHLIDVASPRSTFTVARYQALGRRALRDIFRRGRIPIVCGGTGLYIDALLYDYPLPSVAPNLVLRKKLDAMDTRALCVFLQRLDPSRYKNIDIHNRRRLVRAIEIAKELGSVPRLKTENLRLKTGYEVLKIGILLSKEELQKRIHGRLMKRLRIGMIKETTQLHKNGISWKRLYTLGIEYKYAAHYLQGNITREVMIGAILRESYQYAKRQMTWFKRDSSIYWIRTPHEALALIKHFLQKK